MTHSSAVKNFILANYIGGTSGHEIHECSIPIPEDGSSQENPQGLIKF